VRDSATVGYAATRGPEFRGRGAGIRAQWGAGGEGPCFVSRSYTNDAGTRDYRLFIPTASRARPLPLVIMLHGCNQTPDEFAHATRMNALAEDRRFYVAYPAQRQSANPARCWNWFDSSHQRRGRGEPAIIAGLARHLVERHGLDARRVYVAGLSAGGAMAAILGRLYPDLFAAVGVHSGLPYAAACDSQSALVAMHRGTRDAVHDAGHSRGFHGAEPAAAMPTIVFHGDRDATVHPGNALAVAAQGAGPGAARIDAGAIATGAKVEVGSPRAGTRRPYTCTRFRAAREAVVVEQWLVHGGGHAWFGGDPRERFTDSNGPNASEEMIRFFLSHALEPAVGAAPPLAVAKVASGTPSRSRQHGPGSC
jgi:poly(hydroxyalkanoate) depolymerase family esterase